MIFMGSIDLNRCWLTIAIVAKDEILPAILDDLIKFHGSKSFEDDITMFLVHVV